MRGLPDHAVIDRLVRGRAWIPVLGVLLTGIVAMQVSMLKLNASIGRSIERSTALQSQNQQLRASVATLADDQRIERIAAGMGMIMPAPAAVGFLSAQPTGGIGQAVANIKTPDAATFLASLPRRHRDRPADRPVGLRRHRDLVGADAVEHRRVRHVRAHADRDRDGVRHRHRDRHRRDRRRHGHRGRHRRRDLDAGYSSTGTGTASGGPRAAPAPAAATTAPTTGAGVSGAASGAAAGASASGGEWGSRASPTAAEPATWP